MATNSWTTTYIDLLSILVTETVSYPHRKNIIITILQHSLLFQW